MLVPFEGRSKSAGAVSDGSKSVTSTPPDVFCFTEHDVRLYVGKVLPGYVQQHKIYKPQQIKITEVDSARVWYEYSEGSSRNHSKSWPFFFSYFGWVASK